MKGWSQEAAEDDQEIEVEVEVEVDDEEEPELAVDEIGGDYWWEDEQNGLLWIEHRVPRRTMVQPGGPGCPYRGDEFEDGRWTKIIPADTMDLRDAWEIRDNWRTEGNCDAPFLSWCGTTVFAFRGHDIGDDPPWGDFRGSGIEPGPGDPEGDPRPEDESEGDGEGDSGRDEAEMDEGTAPDAQDEGDGGVCDAGGQEVRGSSEED